MRTVILGIVTLFVTVAGVPEGMSDAISIIEANYPGSMQSGAVGINNVGQIIGWYEGHSGPTFGFLKNGDTYISVEGPPGTFGIQLTGINDLGQIVGNYKTSENGSTVNHAFIWEHGFFTELAGPPGSFSYLALDINNQGQILGTYTLDGNQWYGSIATDDLFTTFDPPGTMGQISAFNDAGHVVGFYGGGDNVSYWRGFLWDGATFTTINGPPEDGVSDTLLEGINNLGQIAGSARIGTFPEGDHQFRSDFFSFVLEGGEYTFLDKPGAAEGSWIRDINDLGHVVGRTNPAPFATPEPSQFWLLAAGLIASLLLKTVRAAKREQITRRIVSLMARRAGRWRAMVRHARVLGRVLALIIVLISIKSTAYADTIYTYTGNPFTGAFGNYPCPGCALTFSITLHTALPVNFVSGVTPSYNPASQENDLFPWSNNNGHISLSNSTLSDGLQSIVPTSINFGNLGNPNFYFYSTDANGLPTEWLISVQVLDDAFVTASYSGETYDFSIHRPHQGYLQNDSACHAGFQMAFSPCSVLQGADSGVFNLNSPGTWSMRVVARVPEPAAIVLLGVGVGILGLAARRNAAFH